MNTNKRPVFHSQRAALRAWRRRSRRRAQTLVEYALIIAVVSIVAIGVLVNLQRSIRGIYTMVNTQLILSAAKSSH